MERGQTVSCIRVFAAYPGCPVEWRIQFRNFLFRGCRPQPHETATQTRHVGELTWQIPVEVPGAAEDSAFLTAAERTLRFPVGASPSPVSAEWIQACLRHCPSGHGSISHAAWTDTVCTCPSTFMHASRFLCPACPLTPASQHSPRAEREDHRPSSVNTLR